MLTQSQSLSIYGKKLRKLIDKSPYSQSEIAAAINMSETTLCNLLTGKGNPAMDSYFRVIIFLKRHPNDVFSISKKDLC